MRRLIIESFTKPKKILDKIITKSNNKDSFKLIFLVGVLLYLENSKTMNVGDNIGIIPILLFSLIFGLVGGLLYIYLWDGLLKLTGKLYKGQATSNELRFGIIWASSPIAILLVIQILEFIIFRGIAYSSVRLIIIQQSAILTIVGLLFSGIRLLILIWWIILMIVNIAYVQKFSIIKSILNILIIIIPMSVITYFIQNLIK